MFSQDTEQSLHGDKYLLAHAPMYTHHVPKVCAATFFIANRISREAFREYGVVREWLTAGDKVRSVFLSSSLVSKTTVSTHWQGTAPIRDSANRLFERTGSHDFRADTLPLHPFRPCPSWVIATAASRESHAVLQSSVARTGNVSGPGWPTVDDAPREAGMSRRLVGPFLRLIRASRRLGRKCRHPWSHP